MQDSAYWRPPDCPECVSISVFGDIKKLALLFERCSPLLVSVFPMDSCVGVGVSVLTRGGRMKIDVNQNSSRKVRLETEI